MKANKLQSLALTRSATHPVQHPTTFWCRAVAAWLHTSLYSIIRSRRVRCLTFDLDIPLIMRLLRTDEDGLNVQFFNDGAELPPYAILSHTWYADQEEIIFAERKLSRSDLETRKGWQKIEGCKSQALRDNLKYVWVDTLCIDKSSSTELARAINSMYRYNNSRDLATYT